MAMRESILLPASSVAAGGVRVPAPPRKLPVVR
jgi:hypothetical protein